MIESMVTATAMNIGALLRGKLPSAQPTWNAICLADFGDSGVAFLAQPQIPPRNVNWSSKGEWVHLAKVAFEKYFLRKIRRGESEPFYERFLLDKLNIAKIKEVENGDMSDRSKDRLWQLRKDQPAARRTGAGGSPLRILPPADLQRPSDRGRRGRLRPPCRKQRCPRCWSTSGRPGAVLAARWRRCSNAPRRSSNPTFVCLKLNSDTAPNVSSRLGISGIPTLLLMQGGREISRTSGAMDAQQIVAWTMAGLAPPQ